MYGNMERLKICRGPPSLAGTNWINDSHSRSSLIEGTHLCGARPASEAQTGDNHQKGLLDDFTVTFGWLPCPIQCIVLLHLNVDVPPGRDSGCVVRVSGAGGRARALIAF